VIKRLPRQFWLLAGSATVANLGAWLLVVAIPVHIYAITGSVTAASIMVIVETAPGVILAPLAGLVVDRVDRRRLLVVGHLLRAAVVAAMLASNDDEHLWMLFLLVFIENAVTQFAQPAQRSLLPAVLGRGSELETGNAWMTAASGVVRLVGAPIGGAVYGLWGFSAAVMLDAVAYVIAGLLITALKPAGHQNPSSSRTENAGLRAEVKRAGNDLAAGIRLLNRHPTLRPLLIVSATFLLTNGALTVLVVPYVSDELHGGGPQVGLMFSALGAGYLLSAPIGSLLIRRLSTRPVMAVVLGALAVCFSGMFNSHSLPVAVLALGLAGIPGGTLLLLIQVQVQRHSPDDFLGRVNSAFMTVESTATVVGSVVAGALAGYIGVRATANLSILLIFVSVVLALTGLREGVRGNAKPLPASSPSVG